MINNKVTNITHDTVRNFDNKPEGMQNQNDFIICAWNSIDTTMMDTRVDVRHALAEMCDAGFNATGIWLPEDPHKREWVIREIEKQNIHLIVKSCLKFENDDIEKLKDLLTRLNQSKALYGFVLRDEPSVSNFLALARAKRICEVFLQNRRFVFCNLFPNYATHDQLGVVLTESRSVVEIAAGIDTMAYDKHLQQYLNVFQPELLCYDHYPITAELREGNPEGDYSIYRYFANLSSIHKAAAQANIPFWIAIQSFGYSNTRIAPDIGEYRWMLHTAIAMGAKGIIAFSYRNLYPEAGGDEKWRDCPVTQSGERTHTYEVVRQCHYELLAYSEVFMTFHHTDVILFNCPDIVIKALSGIVCEDDSEPITDIFGTGCLIIGRMRRPGQIGLYLANASFKDQVDVQINFGKTSKGIIWGKQGKEMQFLKRIITIHLESGEAKFLVLDYS